MVKGPCHDAICISPGQVQSRPPPVYAPTCLSLHITCTVGPPSSPMFVHWSEQEKDAKGHQSSKFRPHDLLLWQVPLCPGSSRLSTFAPSSSRCWTLAWIMFLLCLGSVFPHCWKWAVLSPCLPMHGFLMTSFNFSMLSPCATDVSAAHLCPDLVVTPAPLTSPSLESLYIIITLMIGVVVMVQTWCIALLTWSVVEFRATCGVVCSLASRLLPLMSEALHRLTVAAWVLVADHATMLTIPGKPDPFFSSAYFSVLDMLLLCKWKRHHITSLGILLGFPQLMVQLPPGLRAGTCWSHASWLPWFELHSCPRCHVIKCLQDPPCLYMGVVMVRSSIKPLIGGCWTLSAPWIPSRPLLWAGYSHDEPVPVPVPNHNLNPPK